MSTIAASIRAAAAGMQAQQANLNVIANNLANANTTGFKKNKLHFVDLLYERVQPGAPRAHNAGVVEPLRRGIGSVSLGGQACFGLGAFEPVDNPLGMAIEGEGFFRVRLDDGSIGYTRDGNFGMDADGRIVTATGFMLLPETTIDVPTDGLTISPDGIIQAAAIEPGQGPRVIGQIELARFPNPSGLTRISDNLFAESPASGAPIGGNPGTNGIGTVVSFAVERSNVEVSEEVLNMIQAQRAYQMSSRALQSLDEMVGMANGLRR